MDENIYDSIDREFIGILRRGKNVVKLTDAELKARNDIADKMFIKARIQLIDDMIINFIELRKQLLGRL